jgi:hypothetical protein
MLAHHNTALPPKNGKKMNTILGISLSSISWSVRGYCAASGSIRAYSTLRDTNRGQACPSMLVRDHDYSISEHQNILVYI